MLRRLCRTRLTLHSRLTVWPRWMSGNVSELSDGELRERLRRAVNLGNRAELLRLHEAISSDFLKLYEKKQHTSPPIRSAEDLSANIELKTSRVNPYGTGCYAARAFAKGEVVCRMRGEINDKPDFESIQIDEGKHLHLLRPEVFLNHACEPNGFVDWSTMEFRTLRPVQAGEQLTWNYNTSEWVLQRAFRCQCGARVEGFKFLKEKDRQALLPYLSPFIAKQLQIQQATQEQQRAVRGADSAAAL